MSGHTPGPWEVVEPSEYFFPTRIFSGSHYIASVSNTGDTQEQRMRDARLIAAAPDLLKALVDLLDDLKLRAKLEGTHVLDVSHGRYMRAEDAIAKATGNAPGETTMMEGEA